jgi:regulator of sigma E protease
MLESLNQWLTNFWYGAQVALGIGFLIFIHELGHFLLAKWNGVKVEKFSIGFGPTLLGMKRGETAYVLAAIPLGGFVKMLGEGPEDDSSKSTDPRAYNNKSVSARMAIISAGVIMNVILGLGCFVYAYGQGLVTLPAKVGSVEAGSPAYEAGLRPGDEILELSGRGDLSWSSMTMRVVLNGSRRPIRFGVKRPGRSGLIELDIQPRREPKSDRPTIGVRQSSSLIIHGFAPLAGLKDPPAFPAADATKAGRPIDTLVAAGPVGMEPTPLADIVEYDRLLARYRDQPLRHVIERREGPIDKPGKVLSRFELTIPPVYFVDFGIRMTIEPINGIQKESPAEQAGFRKGDRIVKVEGRDDFDPMKLPSLCYEKAGKPMTFEVERTAADGAKSTLTLTVTPDDTPPWAEVPGTNEALEVPGLGLCYPILPHVAGVRPESPAARAGIKPGDVVNSLTFTPVRASESSATQETKAALTPSRPISITLDETPPAWVSAFWAVQERPGDLISLIVNKGSRAIELVPEPQPDWYFHSRGLVFMPLFLKLPPQNVASALRRGWDDMVENIVGIYGTIRSLLSLEVSPRQLAGPLRIPNVAYEVAKSGFTELIRFLGILSINLAVINFLPIPPLDGGQMLFLIAEKVRGRPLPDSALSAGLLVGIVLVVALILFVLFQDARWLIDSFR